MNKEVDKWIDEHLKDMLDDIMELVAIKSVKGSYDQGKPFGEGPFRALSVALSKCEKYGFSVKNYENYVGTADFSQKLPRTLDILAHLDVVPAGEGWTVTEPFKPLIQNGKVYGRGTSDDKGPAICALYAMRAIKECGIPLKKGVRLVLGTDEETGSGDIKKYYGMEDEAEMTFSPDGEFPIINIEKGQLRGTLKCSFDKAAEGAKIVSFKSGVAVNAVPQKAEIEFEGLDMNSVSDIIKETEKECDVKIEITGISKITVWGKSAHASTPEMGKNALVATLLLVSKLPLTKSEQIESLKSLLELFPYGVTDGSGLGVKMSDEKSGALTATLDMIELNDDYMEAKFDSRLPICADKENCEDIIKKNAENKGLKFETSGMVAPHHVSEDSEFIKTLLSAYNDVTGYEGECLAIGGGTYVHDLKNGIAFGAQLPGVDTNMHGADEFMTIPNILIATKIFAESIIRLCS